MDSIILSRGSPPHHHASAGWKNNLSNGNPQYMLPTELILEIFERLFADKDSQATGAVLATLSRSMNSWVETRLYRRVEIRTEKAAKGYIAALAKSPRRREFLQTLIIDRNNLYPVVRDWSLDILLMGIIGENLDEQNTFVFPPHFDCLHVNSWLSSGNKPIRLHLPSHFTVKSITQSLWSLFIPFRLTHLRLTDASVRTHMLNSILKESARITHLSYMNLITLSHLASAVETVRSLLSESLPDTIERLAIILYPHENLMGANARMASIAAEEAFRNISHPKLVLLTSSPLVLAEFNNSDDSLFWNRVEREHKRQHPLEVGASKRV